MQLENARLNDCFKVEMEELNMEWKGANALLLSEYFENKEKLFELKKKKEYLDYRGEDIFNLEEEIKQIQISIIEFISGLDSQHLKSIIYMSLDMDVDVNIGFPDKLME